MESIINKNTMVVFISALIAGYFFSTIHNFEQRAVDAGLVLAEVVVYPDQISPMKEYFLKSWTSINQTSKLLLDFNFSLKIVSKIIIFLVTILYFLGVFLTVNSATKSILLSILLSVMILIFQKNMGDTDYPSLFFSEHTYGMMSLALVTCIFGLLISGNLFLGGLLSSLLISIHPLVGAWLTGIIIVTLIINKYFFKINYNKKNLIKGLSVGLIFTLISLFYHLYIVSDFNSQFDLKSYENYMKYWEGHRFEAAYHLEYFLKTLLLFIFTLISLKIFKNKFTENFRFGILFIFNSIILSTFFYFFYKFFHSYMPDIVFRIMPTRFTIIHSVIGWPIILSIIFVLLKSFENKKYIFKNLSYSLILFVIIGYSISHYKVFIKLKNSFLINTSTHQNFLEEEKFWNTIKHDNLSGYILTSFSTSTISMRKTFKPILLDVSSFDFIPYFPNTAKNVSLIVEKIYGIPFDQPPKNIRNRPFLTDENIRPIFESYSNEKWKVLSKNFNFKGIIIPTDWVINLPLKIKSKKFSFYII